MIKKKKIVIGSSSFLLPKNSSWRELSDKFDLHFSEFANYNEIFRNKNKNKIICFILFFEDLNKDLDFDNDVLINKQLNFLINLMELRLKNSPEPLIFCYSMRNNFNVIREARVEDKVNLKFQKIHLKVNKLKKKYSNYYTINLSEQFAEVGTNNVFDDRNWYFARCRLSQKGLNIISQSILKIINRVYNSASKVLVLDCDNTLWGGVIGEDGIKNIQLGQDGIGKAYVDFQKSIRKISNEGILLALSSKNNEKDVWEVFNKHKSMIIKKKDIISSRINWKNKANSIFEISKELDLGLKSFVFWDDNPMERNIVKKHLPEVNVVDVGEDVCKWPNILLEYDSFKKFKTTKEDLNKKKQYIIRSKFIKEKLESFDEIKYLKSISLKPTIYSISNSNISRAEQLCQKTNQFNLRNIRYTQTNIEKMNQKSGNKIFIVGLKDIFGDHGLVGLVILKKVSNEFYFLDNLMISCRVFGRYLESWILKTIIDILKSKQCKYLLTEFVKTPKNQIALDFLKKNNFKLFPVKQLKKFRLKINKNIFKTKNAYIFDVLDGKIPNLEVFK